MSVVGKKFNQELWDQSDKLAKDITKRFFKEVHGIDLVEGTKYGVDLVGPDGVQVECEVKQAFNDPNSYKFPDLRYSFRKSKFLKGDLSKTHFVTIAGDGGALIIVPGETVANSPIKEVKNRYSNGETEKFYAVSITDPSLDFWFFEPQDGSDI